MGKFLSIFNYRNSEIRVGGRFGLFVPEKRAIEAVSGEPLEASIGRIIVNSQTTELVSELTYSPSYVATFDEMFSDGSFGPQDETIPAQYRLDILVPRRVDPGEYPELPQVVEVLEEVESFTRGAISTFINTRQEVEQAYSNIDYPITDDLLRRIAASDKFAAFTEFRAKHGVQPDRFYEDLSRESSELRIGGQFWYTVEEKAQIEAVAGETLAAIFNRIIANSEARDLTVEVLPRPNNTRTNYYRYSEPSSNDGPEGFIVTITRPRNTDTPFSTEESEATAVDESVLAVLDQSWLFTREALTVYGDVSSQKARLLHEAQETARQQLIVPAEQKANQLITEAERAAKAAVQEALDQQPDPALAGFAEFRATYLADLATT